MRVTAAMRPYEPRGAALEGFYCRDPEVLLSGPAGTGKSRWALEKIHACMENWPGSRALLLRKSRASLTESALVTFEDKVLPVGHRALTPVQRRNRQSYQYPNGSEIIVGGLDKPDKVMSTEYDMAFIMEAIECFEDDWEKVTVRLRNGIMPFQQLIADTNPGPPSHWLKKRERLGLLRIIESRHEDNPEYWDAGAGMWTPKGVVYVGRLDRLTGVRLDRLRHGRWVAAEGVVYDGWDARIHLIDQFEIPESWRRFRAIDFGYTNPFVCQWWAVDPDGRMYMYREIYHTQRTVTTHAVTINALSGMRENEATVCDHDAGERAQLAADGIGNIPAFKGIQVGIQAGQERLRAAGDGRPRLFIMRDALVERDPLLADAKLPGSTVEEVDGYIWKLGPDGKPLKKEEPVDRDNHGMDTMRYAVAYVDGLSSGRQSLTADMIMSVAR